MVPRELVARLAAGSVAGMAALVLVWTSIQLCGLHPPELIALAAVGLVAFLTALLFPALREPPPPPPPPPAAP